MAKNSADAYGAEGKTNLLLFNPENLVLVTDKTHPLYDERVHLPISERMVLNIMHHGVKTPIQVRKNRETGKVEVVAGRQRVKNAIEANKRLVAKGCEPIGVPASVVGGDDGELFGVMVSENELRESDSPIGRAEKMRQYMALGKSEEQVAVIFGCTAQTIKSSLALLECCAAVRNAVDAGKINITHAKALSKLEPAEQKDKLAILLEAGEGATGHAKAKKQAAAVAADKPKMKGKKEIQAAIDCADDEFTDYRHALRWVLGVE